MSTLFSRRSGLAVVGTGLSLLVLAGCSEDNEAAFKQQAASAPAKTEGDVPPPPQAKNMDDYAKQHQQQQQNMYGGSGGYPGAKRK